MNSKELKILSDSYLKLSKELLRASETMRQIEALTGGSIILNPINTPSKKKEKKQPVKKAVKKVVDNNDLSKSIDKLVTEIKTTNKNLDKI